MQERALRFAYMITEQAQKRARILTFWKKHGLQAAIDAYGIHRRTLFEWQRRLKKTKGKLEGLNPQHTAPKKVRKRMWDPRIIDELRRLRDVHKNLSGPKLYPLLKEYSDSLRLDTPKPRTITRLVKDMGGLRKAPQRLNGRGKVKKQVRVKVLRKPKDFKATHVGHCVAFDTIEEYIHGVKCYIVTAIDLHTRYAFALGVTSHASSAAAEFFALWQQVFPVPIETVLTDNGSEFKMHFTKLLLEKHVTHYHTRPRTPKMNAHCERFNRTLQEECTNYHRHLLAINRPKFNGILAGYLLFYNTKRVHWAFHNKLSPVQFMLSSQVTVPRECRKGWLHTDSC